MNPFFVDYLIPTINIMPRIETTLVHGYPGAKGAGEIACVPPMACIGNAIFNATGVRIKTLPLPLSPENVLRGLKEAGKALDHASREKVQLKGRPSGRPFLWFDFRLTLCIIRT